MQRLRSSSIPSMIIATGSFWPLARWRVAMVHAMRSVFDAKMPDRLSKGFSVLTIWPGKMHRGPCAKVAGLTCHCRVSRTSTGWNNDSSSDHLLFFSGIERNSLESRCGFPCWAVVISLKYIAKTCSSRQPGHSFGRCQKFQHLPADSATPERPESPGQSGWLL